MRISEAGDGFDLGEGEFAFSELEEELGADFGEFFGGDVEGALKGLVLADELEVDGFTEDDAVAGFDFHFAGIHFIAPFLVAGGVAGGGIEVEFALVEVHVVSNLKF
jgi:hypothetical protein